MGYKVVSKKLGRRLPTSVIEPDAVAAVVEALFPAYPVCAVNIFEISALLILFTR